MIDKSCDFLSIANSYKIKKILKTKQRLSLMIEFS